MFAISEISGLPAHPLLVHIPVILVPLGLLGAIAALARRRWRDWLLPLVAGAAGVSVVAIQLAIGAGQNLEEKVGGSELIDRHADLGRQTRPLVIVFFLAAAAVAYVHHRQAGPERAVADDTRRAAEGPVDGWGRLLLPLAALSVLTGGLATAWVVRTGDSGTEAVWVGEIGYGKRDASKDGSGGGDAPEGDPAPASAAKEVKVDITDFAFGPDEVTVKVGAKVTWTNSDSAPHTATSRGTVPEDFATKDLAQGDSDSVTFTKPGTYTYVCDFHPYMTGTVTVTE